MLIGTGQHLALGDNQQAEEQADWLDFKRPSPFSESDPLSCHVCHAGQDTGTSAVGNLAPSKSGNVAVCGDKHGIPMLLPPGTPEPEIKPKEITQRSKKLPS